jgi:hypothetical protein
MNRRTVIVGALVAAGIAGCAAPGTPFASLEPVAADKGHLYLYRKPALYAFGAKYKVTADGAQIGELSNGSYLLLPLAPGKHRLSVHEGGLLRPKSFEVDVQAGQNYFVEYDSSRGLLLGWGLLSDTKARSEAEAMADLNGLSRAN